MFRIQFVIGLITILSASMTQATAGKKKACTLEGLSNNCQHFQADGKDVVEYPDGSIIPNFAKLSAAWQKEGVSEDSPETNKKDLKKLESQLNEEVIISGLLDQQKLNKQGLVFYSNPHNLNELFNGSAREKLSAVSPMGRGSTGKIVDIRKGELRSQLRSALGDKALVALKQSSKKWEELEQSRPTLGPKALVDRLKPTEESKKRVNETFKLARKEAVEVILAGRDRSKLSASEQAMIIKIENVELKSLDELQDSEECSDLLPNAFYDNAENSVTVCPSMYNYPRLALLEVIAHEIGHSVDPCNHQFGVFKASRSRVEDIVYDDESLGKLSAGTRNELFELADILEEDSDQVIAFSAETSSSELEELEKLTGVKRISKDVAFSDYPLSGPYSCLAASDKGGFRHSSGEALDKFADEIVAGRAEKLGLEYDKAKDRAKVLATLHKHPECVQSTGKSSNMSEVMCDWMASQVLARELKRNPVKSDLEKIAPIAVSTAMACLERTNGKFEDHTYEQSIKRILDDAEETQGAHPVSTTRLEQITLAHPDIAAALECETSAKTRECFDWKGSEARTAPPAATRSGKASPQEAIQ